MENQGKREEQVRFSEKMVFASIIGIAIVLIGVLFLAS